MRNYRPKLAFRTPSQYETRSWVGWHHHMTLVGLAHLFVTLTRRRLQHQVPELTLDRTVRLLEAALEEAELRLPRAVALVEYHVGRNKIAKASRDKTWKKKHEGVKYLRRPCATTSRTGTCHHIPNTRGVGLIKTVLPVRNAP